MTNMRRQRRVGTLALVLGLLVLMVAFFSGPRVSTDIPSDISEQVRKEWALSPTVRGLDGPHVLRTFMDSVLAAQEEAVRPAVWPGAEKEIVWANDAFHTGRPGASEADMPVRTPLSIVYVHGFSATKHEIMPVPERVARAMGANLFYTRLTGHGQGATGGTGNGQGATGGTGNGHDAAEAMGRVSLTDWARDVAEAVHIGEAIGERVVLMGTSTGGTLATWAAMQPNLRARVAAVVLISPNFGPKDRRSEIMLWPWGAQLLRVIQGDEFSWAPQNDGHSTWWTTTYASKALLPMMAAVKVARELPVERLSVPVFVAFSPGDQVVSADETIRFIERLTASSGNSSAGGSEDERGSFSGVGRVDTVRGQSTGNRNNHGIAGDILSPDRTEDVARRIIQFLRRALPDAPRPDTASPDTATPDPTSFP